ncbi:DNA/RNA polymerases superfamily protein [Cucumis melo var. makuwa]|uniref:DNA/RNA polymerases superfamily protein n=1 Tax=Cucumis melo var. makuwa TaxID=1194695 RepID=A0A5A7SRF4_CUCMM|nr:DNA/RNA polymerases superfamily protein [Cucumis melo var. makuwa]TYK03429.1 DNA/RNA polymerases superfamily protein [Cucumis melo var. makuwa]
MVQKTVDSPRSKGSQPYQQDKTEPGLSGVKGSEMPKSHGKVSSMTRSEAKDNPHVITDLKSPNKTPKNGLLISTPSGELDELDVILGMDSLTKYHAILDCSNKKIVLRNLENFEIKFEGDKKANLGRIISILKVKKLIKKGHAAYLAHMVDTGYRRMIQARCL